MSYWGFAAMIATSTVVMFGLMYLNTYLWDHVFWSETRAYMAVLMGATMAIVMLAWMLSMYDSTRLNLAIFAGAALVFAGSLWLVRSQATVSDQSYLRAMIPHHSIAIMTSSRANLEDRAVRKLADEIIYAQDKEIAEMRYLVDRIEDKGKLTGDAPAPAPEVVGLDAALSRAHVAVLDPSFLRAEQIGAGLAQGAECRFAYTTESPASVAIGAPGDAPEASEAPETVALVSLNGALVRLPLWTGSAPAGSEVADLAFRVAGLTLEISGTDDTPLDLDATGWQKADMTFALDARGEELRAGFRGFFRCGT